MLKQSSAKQAESNEISQVTDLSSIIKRPDGIVQLGNGDTDEASTVKI